VTVPLQLTYPGVLVAVLAEQLCLPIPSVVFLMAAGALSARGEMRTSVVILMGVSACLAADGLWFSFGRRWGSGVLRLLCRFSADPRQSFQDAHEKFQRHGLPVLCVAKFVPGLNLVMPPLAGAEGASLSAFLPLDIVGGLLWTGFYVGLGYLFSKQVDIAIGWVEHFGMVVGIAVGVPLCLYVGSRGFALVRMIRRLRLRRITPRLLARKLKSDARIVVLDLLDFEASETASPEAIPGALRVDPSVLRKSPHVTVPDGVEAVLYSSSGGDMVAARAALALNRIGVKNVWVLEGGLKAWRGQGLPVSETPEVPEVVAERVGVRLPTV
jgi:membrane protein DedA with SNARE-associated domain/rhodanese-related sulfurtransferase